MPLVRRSFDEERRDRCSDRPASIRGHVIEELSIRARRRKQLHVRKPIDVHPQPARIHQEQLRVRLARRQAAGFFLVEVLRQLSSHFGDRTLHVRASHHDRKVPNVDFPLLLEVDVQLISWHETSGEGWPSPVRLSLHLLKQGLLELGYIHSFKVEVGRASVENA